MDKIFLLHHIHEMPDGSDDVKFIGAYSSESDALLAAERAKRLPGFSDCPGGFTVQGYEIGADHWTEGYFTWTPDSE